MIYFCYFLIGLLLIRVFVALFNVLSFAYLPKRTSIDTIPSVSILIPARDEEVNIGTLLGQLSTLDYASLEIIVYNDHSSDETESVVKHWASLHSNIRVINGQQPPMGWLGKNYACHRLAQAATGSILLFLDADVSLKKDLIDRSIGHFQRNQLHLLSIFPKQILKTFGEKVSVPLMNWILLSLLPLSLIRASKIEAFSAANGQFMMFNAATYKVLWPHERYKSHRVEDIAILRLFKRKNLASDTRLGDNDITCRMYHGLDAAIEGFTKNIFQFFGNSILATVCFGIVTTIAPFVLYVHMGIVWLGVYLAGIVLVRILVSLASQQAVIQNVLLAFPQQIVFLIIIVQGVINSKRKKILWKGRNILLGQ